MRRSSSSPLSPAPSGSCSAPTCRSTWATPCPSTGSGAAVSTEDLARDTLALMDTLEVERAHVVGRSMGGAIAQHMALLAPDRIQSLALLASFARLDPVGRRVLTNMRQVLEWTGSWESHA